eukprot:TRINITY_DN21583_c0_g1_i1.p1 TRINITY_DN21583_c0_g1~~TRINITY_DN21583_c0_g1_i1.p1  ORF type:complete len:341 (+),score=105.67 TRINITY_DN21583_c0_g1_i1:123-1145(+)
MVLAGDTQIFAEEGPPGEDLQQNEDAQGDGDAATKDESKDVQKPTMLRRVSMSMAPGELASKGTGSRRNSHQMSPSEQERQRKKRLKELELKLLKRRQALAEMEREVALVAREAAQLDDEKLFEEARKARKYADELQGQSDDLQAKLSMVRLSSQLTSLTEASDMLRNDSVDVGAVAPDPGRETKAEDAEAKAEATEDELPFSIMHLLRKTTEGEAAKAKQDSKTAKKDGKTSKKSKRKGISKRPSSEGIEDSDLPPLEDLLSPRTTSPSHVSFAKTPGLTFRPDRKIDPGDGLGPYDFDPSYFDEVASNASKAAKTEGEENADNEDQPAKQPKACCSIQ